MPSLLYFTSEHSFKWLLRAAASLLWAARHTLRQFLASAISYDIMQPSTVELEEHGEPSSTAEDVAEIKSTTYGSKDLPQPTTSTWTAWASKRSSYETSDS